MAPTVADLPPYAPERIGKYEILLPIASGGMATVYLARVQGVGGFERDVAIKLTHGHLLDSPEFAVDLIEEAKLAARIRHPNVVPTLDVGEDRLGVFLVMEYVEGDSLAGLRRRAANEGEALPRPIALRIMLDALAGLHEAHELRDRQGRLLDLVHRDFSPQNILVGVDGLARLTDFGVAKAVSRLGHTRTGLVKGKLPYMAPEQARGEPLDRRCDVWAAGVVTWELLAGRRLYGESNDVAIVLKLVSDTPPRLGTIVPDIDPLLERAVASALAPKRDERCPTADAFARALREAGISAGGIAEREQCAEYVRKLVGARIAKRQQRIDEVWKLRAKVDELSRQEREESSTATPSSDIQPPLRVIGPEPARSRYPDLDELSVDVTRDETTEIAAADADAGLVEDTVEAGQGSAEHTRTDAVSVSTTTPSDAIEQAVASPLRSSRWRWAVLGGGALVAAVAALAATGASEPDDAEPASSLTERAAADATSVASVAAASSTTGVVDDPPSGSAVRTDSIRLVDVEANAAVAALRIDGQSVSIDRPSRRFTAETARRGAAEDAVVVEARATDGRRLTTELAGGDEVLRLEFPPPVRGSRRPSSTPTAESPIPPSPYRGAP